MSERDQKRIAELEGVIQMIAIQSNPDWRQARMAPLVTLDTIYALTQPTVTRLLRKAGP